MVTVNTAIILQQNAQRVPQREDDIVQHDLVLAGVADDVEHDVALGLEHHHPVVVEDDVARLLARLLHQALLERLLVLERRVRLGGREPGRRRRGVRRRVVLGQHPRRVVGGKDQHGRDGEERHVGSHLCVAEGTGRCGSPWRAACRSGVCQWPDICHAVRYTYFAVVSKRAGVASLAFPPIPQSCGQLTWSSID